VRLAWEQSVLPGLARRLGADVIHSPHYTMPIGTRRPVVVTVHDATFFTDPGLHTRLKGRFFRTATRIALRRATRAVVPSEATRQELTRVVGGKPAVVDVIPHGVDAVTFSPPVADEIVRVRQRLGLGDQPYIAFLGTLEPRKNVAGLLRGWVQAFREDEIAPVLVLAGGPGWDSGLEQALAQVPSSMQALTPGYLPIEDLAGFLGGALVVAYPSLGEGFGLPVLEAMACGAPILTTRRLSLPEVGGDAVAYTEPDPASIGRALRELAHDGSRRASLGRAALQRSQQFSWDASAAAHLETYDRAARAA
jgi:glycosyltransferase involved in cell wall biosynthesis